MSTINLYLTFNGNCRDAMLFYKECLGGILSFQTFGESPLLEDIPAKMKNCILHSVLKSKHFVLMGSDIVSENGLLKGNTVSIVLNCKSEKKIREYYKKLSQGGVQTYPLENTFWNAIFGGLTDKYGNTWLFNYNSKKNNQ